MASAQYDNDTQIEREWEEDEEREEDEVEEEERLVLQETAKQQIYHMLRVQLMFMQNAVTILDVACLDVRTYYSRYYNKQPYHTSALTGNAWVQELLAGHPERIRSELGVHKHVFKVLLQLLHNAGYNDSKHVSLEEQLSIFLYASVTGLSTQHIGERFQRSNNTITRYTFFSVYYRY